MTKRFIICKGLPGSGKSTWAKEYAKLNADAVRINNDELQLMMFGQAFKKNGGQDLRIARETLIAKFLSRGGVDIIVDNTNLHPDRATEYADMVANHNLTYPHKYTFSVQDFTDVPLSVCLQRNAGRPKESQVPEKVIWDMFEQYVKPHMTSKIGKQDKTLPRAMIVDIDGTIAEMTNRGPFDDTKYYDDAVIEDVLYNIKTLEKAGSYVIFLTGRAEKGRADTVRWLNDKAGFAPGSYTLIMRTDGDKTSDFIYKEEAYVEHVLGKYYVHAWFEDRVRNVNMARYKLGLTAVFQVNEGNF